jgi:hypothetical protein
MNTESQGKFVAASEWVKRLPRAQRLRAPLAQLAAHHCAFVAPNWAKDRAVKGVLGCVLSRMSGVKVKRKPTLRDRQTVEAIRD